MLLGFRKSLLDYTNLKNKKELASKVLLKVKIMCGIVGVVGNKNATDILMQGLEKLEYRGYDSAGIYVTNGTDQGRLIKSVGRISDLRAKIGIDVAGYTGIGHTRWATHGQATETNAHPHTSETGRFVLVHNGVIENYLQIKETYLSEHHLKGETDTEIAVHLVGQFVSEGLSVLEAFKKALTIIEGSYAFALVDSEDADTIYVAKNKSPLLIGLGDGYNMVCSDAMAMIRETSEFMEIHDKELVVLTRDSATVTDYEGNEIERESYTAELDLSDIGKGTYPYYMLKEIDEQPIIMRKIAQTYVNEDNEIPLDHKLMDELLASDRIYIVACGTSYHAGLASKHSFEQMTDIPVEVHLASEFGYTMPLLSKKPFFIFLSQSGETADSRQVLVKINQLGHPSLTITNVAGSTLSREAGFTLLLHAGPEIAVASTKAYTAQIAVLALLAKAVGDQKGNKRSLTFDVAHELSMVANAMETVITQKDELQELAAEFLNDTRNAFYIGRSNDHDVALEAALKLKEISYIQAEGFAAGELKHGTIALIEEGTPVIGIISEEITGAHTRGNLKEVESRGAKTLVIASHGLEKETDQLVIPAVHPYLSPLAMVIPTQLLAYYATLLRGFDVDKPRNLAKSVTVE